ncbi:hypothetical protein H634G_10500 [Metarhizium anisopliae BRIP 53293]|uniref:Uncharacterized protein n=1 Tax=Metarhizium anisopliae BRIP 53293 TaxID=1291518 RepID=A0A0D9NJK5_METAN|nr:hypothetical protein H634G_10500 [Metarhizium anisopliae BRIP 53293]KJK86409.1 hypothetical protein H633G_09750 [Metarhizium anisopliae BRIP 53284]
MNHCGAETRGQPPVSPDYLRDQLLASAHDHPFDHLLYGSLQNDVDVAPAHQMPDYPSDKGPLNTDKTLDWRDAVNRDA